MRTGVSRAEDREGIVGDDSEDELPVKDESPKEQELTPEQIQEAEDERLALSLPKPARKEFRAARKAERAHERLLNDFGGDAFVQDGVTLTRAFHEGPKEFISSLDSLSEARANQVRDALVQDVLANEADRAIVLERIFGRSVSESEIKRLLDAPAPPDATRTQTEEDLDFWDDSPTTATAKEQATPLDSTNLPRDVQERLTELETLQQKFPELSNRLASYEQQQVAERATRLAEEFKGNLWSYADQVLLKDFGLETRLDDSTEEKEYKQAVYRDLKTLLPYAVEDHQRGKNYIGQVGSYLEANDRANVMKFESPLKAVIDEILRDRAKPYLQSRESARQLQRSTLTRDRRPEIASQNGQRASLSPETSPVTLGGGVDKVWESAVASAQKDEQARVRALRAS